MTYRFRSTWVRRTTYIEDDRVTKSTRIGPVATARWHDRDEPPDILSAEDIKHLRNQIAKLSQDSVRKIHEGSFEDCPLTYGRIPSPRKMQTLVQVWKQLWKWRR